jgi:hypothetical protein
MILQAGGAQERSSNPLLALLSISPKLAECLRSKSTKHASFEEAA